uniref:Hypothetical chloroplast RF1 n=1 Tax=Chloropicon maureeniae TaxID=1461542 RepID=A0A4D6C4Z1_9CHLO|nr:hypothetical chloroplast RF1 [Chloropicon maureeniae]QBX98228.1 hypothetical chloroplast RF1 [Chloropicon maureeniae]
MSLVTFVKDTTNFVQLIGQEPFPLAFSHFVTWIAGKFFSIFSFKWLIDFPLFPIFIPKLSTQVIQEGLNINNANQPFESLGFFSSSEKSGLLKLIPGFFNSIFLVLPFSPARILWIRQLLVQGIPAGISSGVGLIVGQSLFLAIVLFGFRPFLHIWSSIEPFSYLIGIVWFFIIFDQLCSNKTPTIKWEDSKSCIQIFVQSCFLGCVEQTTLGQYLSGLTTTGESFFNEGFSSSSKLQFVLTQGSYLIGVVVGLCVFGSLLTFVIWQSSQVWYQASALPYNMWQSQRVHPILLLLYGSCLIASIPYYSWDYLLNKPLGFLPDDKGLDSLLEKWVGIQSDPQLPRWRDYYMRNSGGEGGILGDGWLWSRYDQADFPASQKKRALEAMLISHEWFPHWAKDRGPLNMEYSPAKPSILKQFSRKVASLSVPGKGPIRTLVWPKDRRERTIQRDSIRGVKNWSPNRTRKLNTFWGKLRTAKGLEKSDLLQASRFVAFGRLRHISSSPVPEDNPFVNVASKNVLGNDPLDHLVSKWTHNSRLDQGIQELDAELSVFSSENDKGFKVYSNKRRKFPIHAWLATRSQLMPEIELQKEQFNKFHKYWVLRNLLRPRFIKWRLKPSEENFVWMARQRSSKKVKDDELELIFLNEEKQKLKKDEANLLRLQHYLKVGNELSEKVSPNKKLSSKKSKKQKVLPKMEPSSFYRAFRPLKLQTPEVNSISVQRNQSKYRRNIIKQDRLDARFRNLRQDSEIFLELDGSKERSFVFGLNRPRFSQTRNSQRKGDRRLWRRRVPLRPTPVGPSRWSSFNYFRQQVYQKALATTVDNVMKGQPKDFHLTAGEEEKLLKHKLQLARYYDSLRKYTKSSQFDRFVPGGSRTYTDGVYNHQFKGTLSYIRRLFYVTPLQSQNMEGGRVYKMSQLLYDRDVKNPMVHEEIENNVESKEPFLQALPSPSPFYTGWDNTDHKMILTVRTLPRITAGYRVPAMEDSFTAWPYTTEKIRKLARPRVFTVETINMSESTRMAFSWNWENLQLGFSWRTTPRDRNWYSESLENPFTVKAPLGYWARAQERQVFLKKSLKNRRWNRWYFRIPALPRLGGFSWGA